MTLELLLESLPAHAADLKSNLEMALRQAELTPVQLWGTAVASAAASRNRDLLSAISREAAKVVGAEMIEAALSASAVMGMNNIYFRFVHFAEHGRYSQIPSRLRMNSIRRHGAPSADFELWCVAVSAINGCGACIIEHDTAARKKSLPEEAVLAAIRIASVVHGLACVLDYCPSLSETAPC